MSQPLTTYVDTLAQLEAQLTAMSVDLEGLIGDDPHAEDACMSVAVATQYVTDARIIVTRYLHAAERRAREAL